MDGSRKDEVLLGLSSIPDQRWTPTLLEGRMHRLKDNSVKNSGVRLHMIRAKVLHVGRKALVQPESGNQERIGFWAFVN